MRQDLELRGTTAWNVAQVFGASVLTYDTDLLKYRMHDGVTPGGWLLQREADATVAAVRRFVAENAKSVPATAWLVGDVYDLNTISVAGTYTLPPVSVAGIGDPILVRSLVAGAILQRSGADVINDHGIDVTSLNLTQYEIVELVKRAVGGWLVLRRY